MPDLAKGWAPPAPAVPKRAAFGWAPPLLPTSAPLMKKPRGKCSFQ
jgi:hypothetical protein